MKRFVDRPHPTMNNLPEAHRTETVLKPCGDPIHLPVGHLQFSAPTTVLTAFKPLMTAGTHFLDGTSHGETSSVAMHLAMSRSPLEWHVKLYPHSPKNRMDGSSKEENLFVLFIENVVGPSIDLNGFRDIIGD